MTEHVCEWEYSNILGYFGCAHEVCENTMRLKEAEARLNEYEKNMMRPTTVATTSRPPYERGDYLQSHGGHVIDVGEDWFTVLTSPNILEGK